MAGIVVLTDRQFLNRARKPRPTRIEGNYKEADSIRTLARKEAVGKLNGCRRLAW